MKRGLAASWNLAGPFSVRVCDKESHDTHLELQKNSFKLMLLVEQTTSHQNHPPIQTIKYNQIVMYVSGSRHTLFQKTAKIGLLLQGGIFGSFAVVVRLNPQSPKNDSILSGLLIHKRALKESNFGNILQYYLNQLLF